ncbi:MAG: hypothetical protein WCU88_13555 [Elusimicrobiota bacterium]
METLVIQGPKTDFRKLASSLIERSSTLSPIERRPPPRAAAAMRGPRTRSADEISPKH